MENLIVRELVEKAKTLEEEEQAVVISELHHLGNEDVFIAAGELLNCDVPEYRKIGVDILAQLGVPQRFKPDASVVVLEKLLETERDSDVLNAIAVAFGFLEQKNSLNLLHSLASHNDAFVREGAAFALSSFTGPLATSILLKLAEDEDDEVRNWAIFGLSAQENREDENVINCLISALDDPYEEVQVEALTGLAKLKHSRALDTISKRLVERTFDVDVLKAAYEFGDERLLPLLQEVVDDWDGDANLLNDAIKACSPQ